MVDRPDRHTVVVDNASGDGSAEKIEAAISQNRWDRWARVVQSSRNGGFSAGNNLGISSEPAEFFLLLNSDARVLPDAIDEMIAAMAANPRLGMVGPRLIWPDGVSQNSCFRYRSPISEMLYAARTGPLDRLFKNFVIAMPISETPVGTEWLSFSCVMIRHAVIAEIGPMDEGFFMYFEDIDYCRRAARAGWTIWHEPRAKAIHLRGGSASLKADLAAKRKLPLYYFESRSRYFAKFYGGVIGIVAANLFWIVGRGVAFLRELLERREALVSQNEFFDIWTNWWRPMRPSSFLNK